MWHVKCMSTVWTTATGSIDQGFKYGKVQVQEKQLEEKNVVLIKVQNLKQILFKRTLNKWHSVCFVLNDDDS